MDYEELESKWMATRAEVKSKDKRIARLELEFADSYDRGSARIAELEAQLEEQECEMLMTVGTLRNELAEHEKNTRQPDKELVEALKDAHDTITYCKTYVENRGLSAEDDCISSLELINKVLDKYKASDAGLEKK